MDIVPLSVRAGVAGRGYQPQFPGIHRRI